MGNFRPPSGAHGVTRPYLAPIQGFKARVDIEPNFFIRRPAVQVLASAHPQTMLDRIFRLSENQTNARTEVLAGVTTFLTMAYILVVQRPSCPA